MKRLYKLSVFLLLFALCAGGLSTYSQAKPGPDKKGDCVGHKHHHDKYSKIPDLTEEQKKQIEAFHTKFESEIAPAREQLKAKNDELRTLTRSKNVDMNKVNALVDEIGTLKTSIMKSEVAMKINVWNVLTDAQHNYLESLPKPHMPHKDYMKKG